MFSEVFFRGRLNIAVPQPHGKASQGIVPLENIPFPDSQERRSGRQQSTPGIAGHVTSTLSRSLSLSLLLSPSLSVAHCLSLLSSLPSSRRRVLSRPPVPHNLPRRNGKKRGEKRVQPSPLTVPLSVSLPDSLSLPPSLSRCQWDVLTL